jgi:hypothetical protein
LELLTRDSPVESLSGLGKLEMLALEDTAITDSGLDNLQRLKGLRKLSLRGSGHITAESTVRFAQAVPGVTIEK